MNKLLKVTSLTKINRIISALILNLQKALIVSKCFMIIVLDIIDRISSNSIFTSWSTRLNRIVIFNESQKKINEKN
jgi:hypothetical protein